MCRNIKPLFNYDPPTTKDDIRNASLQFVRKVSGFQSPSQANSIPFETAIDEISRTTEKLLASLITNSKPHNRIIEIEHKRLKQKTKDF
jgi:hypothetical protein